MEEIIKLFNALSDDDKIKVAEEIQQLSAKIMKVEVISETEVKVTYFNKTYYGNYNEGIGWNFWESNSNDLADEESSYEGDINDVDSLTQYFEEYVDRYLF